MAEKEARSLTREYHCRPLSKSFKARVWNIGITCDVVSDSKSNV